MLVLSSTDMNIHHLPYAHVVGCVRGVVRLVDVMYVVCASTTILLYNTDTYNPLDVVIYVEGMRDPCDVTVCRDDRQLYVADWGSHCIWRVSAVDHSYVKWLTIESATDTFHVYTLSVTSQQLLVTFQPPGLRQYRTTDRQLRHIPLPHYVEELEHAVETTRQTFVISHHGTSQDKQQHAVSELFIFFTY